MSEERLQEIQDSVAFQREMLLAHNLGTLCVDEEQELIDEIERLSNELNQQFIKCDKYMTRNEKAIEYIERDLSNINIQENIVAKNELLQIKNIIKGEDKPFDERVEEIYNRNIKYIYGKEDKKIEKIDDNHFERAGVNLKHKIVKDKINEIIDKLNEGDK